MSKQGHVDEIATQPHDAKDSRIVNERRFTTSVQLIRFFDACRANNLGYVSSRQLVLGIWEDIQFNLVDAARRYLNSSDPIPKDVSEVKGNRRTIICLSDEGFALMIDRIETFFYGKTTGKQTQGTANKMGVNETPNGDIQALSNDAVLGFTTAITSLERLTRHYHDAKHMLQRFGVTWKVVGASFGPDWRPNPDGTGLREGTIVTRDILGNIVPMYIFPGKRYYTGHYNEDGEPIKRKDALKDFVLEYRTKSTTLTQAFVLNFNNDGSVNEENVVDDNDDDSIVEV